VTTADLTFNSEKYKHIPFTDPKYETKQPTRQISRAQYRKVKWLHSLFFIFTANLRHMHDDIKVYSRSKPGPQKISVHKYTTHVTLELKTEQYRFKKNSSRF
jgi:hypothetical protein